MLIALRKISCVFVNPEVGGIATVDTLGHTHIITIIEKDKLLDIVINRSSRILRFRPTRYMTFWRIKEARICPKYSH